MKYRETLKIDLIDGTVLKKKLVDFSSYKELREKALTNRTKAEIAAERMFTYFIGKEHFIPEYIFKFRRFDFYFPSIRLAVEIDGSSHDNKQIFDKSIDIHLLNKYNIKIFRIKNFDESKTLEIIDLIKNMLKNPVFMDKRDIKNHRHLRNIKNITTKSKRTKKPKKATKTILRKSISIS